MSRRLRVSVIVALVGLSCIACAPTEPPLPPIPPAPAPSRWARLAEAQRWPEAAPEFPSRGHGAGRFLATVRVIPSALDAYRTIVTGTVFPDGSAIAVFHREPRGAAGSVFVMEKRGAAWSFTAVDPWGTVLDGDLGLCARCHDEAPADHVFGAPRRADVE